MEYNNIDFLAYTTSVRIVCSCVDPSKCTCLFFGFLCSVLPQFADLTGLFCGRLLGTLPLPRIFSLQVVGTHFYNDICSQAWAQSCTTDTREQLCRLAHSGFVVVRLHQTDNVVECTAIVFDNETAVPLLLLHRGALHSTLYTAHSTLTFGSGIKSENSNGMHHDLTTLYAARHDGLGFHDCFRNVLRDHSFVNFRVRASDISDAVAQLSKLNQQPPNIK